MKKSLLLAAACLVAVSAMAVPAKRVKKTITLADGTQREVVLKGDEHVHFWQTEEGSAFQLDEQNVFQQVDLPQLMARWDEKLTERNDVRKARAVKRRVTWGAEQNPVSGQHRGLVILVNFSDKTINSKHDNDFYTRYFNGESFKEEGMYGSVHQYFYDSSYGQFDLEFDVIGPVTVSNTMSYYGSNDASGNDKYAATMVAEACKLANAEGLDWSKYDWDGDGYVDQVFVIYAGYGEAQGAAASTIWPHEYELSSAQYYGDGPGVLSFNGTRVDTYACSCELAGTSGTSVDGIGTACHEFSHCMCIPDMYDTNGSNFGMDYWDLMDYGCYNGTTKSGGQPTGYTSYERWYCGWLTPTELTSYTTVDSLRSLSKYPDAYLIRNQGSKNEYYMLENRQKEGWFGATNAHGMLVVHVDFSSSVWANNTVNNTASRQRMTIIPADGSTSSSSLSGDPFPGTSQKRQLTDTSSPKASTYTTNTHGSKTMNFPIVNIQEVGGVISFVAGNLQLDAPVAHEAEDVTENSFVANWDAVAEAESYEVTLIARDTTTSDADKTLLLSEDFSGFNLGKVGTADVSASMDEYTQTPGWTGSKVFQTAADEAKLGTSSAVGSLTTPEIEAPASGSLTVAVTYRQYNADANKITVTADGTGEDSYISKTVLQDVPATEEKTAVATIALKVNSKLTIATSSKRVYVSGVQVYDGAFSAEDLAMSAPRKASSSRVVETENLYYTFTELDPAYLYSYKVRALRDDKTSDWSELVSVMLKGQEQDPVDAITEVESTLQPSDVIYDLQGRRIAKPNKGIYIISGKKVIK